MAKKKSIRIDKKDRKEKEQTYEEFLRDPETCNYCGNRFDVPAVFYFAIYCCVFYT